MLTQTQIATLHNTGVFSEEIYETFADDAGITFECILWTSQRIYGDESLMDPDNMGAFDQVVEDFEDKFDPQLFERVCMILECA
ncbi:hypothetical protein AHIS2_p054 [Acaryochloris phage A-HIS2]|nr:hypothetical protein AHIS2_p054 [Acaryochloris phage A-HIS2]